MPGEFPLAAQNESSGDGRPCLDDLMSDSLSPARRGSSVRTLGIGLYPASSNEFVSAGFSAADPIQCGGIGMKIGGAPENFERRLISASSEPCGFR